VSTAETDKFSIVRFSILLHGFPVLVFTAPCSSAKRGIATVKLSVCPSVCDIGVALVVYDFYRQRRGVYGQHTASHPFDHLFETQCISVKYLPVKTVNALFVLSVGGDSMKLFICSVV